MYFMLYASNALTCQYRSIYIIIFCSSYIYMYVYIFPLAFMCTILPLLSIEFMTKICYLSSNSCYLKDEKIKIYHSIDVSQVNNC